MLKIFDKLWYVKTQSANPNDTDLSYMTYYEDNAAFKKRQATGLTWAVPGASKTGIIVDNTPQEGFKVLSVESRWTTQNKVFRIRDPRGFVVEIPTGNLNKILECAVVDHGVIMGECIWGREVADHLLIPKNSVLFQEATLNMEKLDSKIKIKDVAVGEIIELTGHSSLNKVIYLGKFKGKYTGEAAESGSWGYNQKRNSICTFDEYTDKKWWLSFVNVSALRTIEGGGGFVGHQSRRTVKVVGRSGDKVERDIVDKLRAMIKYTDTTEACKHYRAEFRLTSRGQRDDRARITAKFQGAVWQ
jgi:uncharacterized protein YkvS